MDENKPKIKGKRGRRKNIKTIGLGMIDAVSEQAVKAVLQLKVSKVLSDEEYTEELKQIAFECLRIIKLNAQSIALENVQYVKTPNGPKSIHVGGFPPETMNIVIQTMNLVSRLLDPQADQPKNNKDISSLLKAAYRPPFPGAN